MRNINGTIPGCAVDPRFGRCQYFVIVDSETMEYEAMQNPSIGAVRRRRNTGSTDCCR